MSDFTATVAPNSDSPVPNPPQTSGDFAGTADGAIDGHGTGSFAPTTPLAAGNGAQVSVVGWGGGSLYVILYGNHPQNYFTSVALGAPANLSFNSVSAAGYSNTSIPGYTYWSWVDSHEFTYIGDALPVTFSGVAAPAAPIGGQGDITNPGAWEDANGVIPPLAYQNVPQTVNFPLNGDGRYWFQTNAFAANPTIQTFIGDPAFLVDEVALQTSIVQAANDGSEVFVAYSTDGSTFTQQQLGPSVQSAPGSQNGPAGQSLLSNQLIVSLVGATTLIVKVLSTGGTASALAKTWQVAVAITRNTNERIAWDYPNPFNPVSYNCECADDVVPTETLATLRTDILIELGFASQSASPPPGMALLVNSWLIRGQKYLYRRYSQLHTRRMFRWKVNPGQRFYSLKDNDEDVLCNYQMDPLKQIEWAGIQDSRNVWYPLVEGIEPQLYTMIDKPWRPARYEIRQCIELYPAPDQTYWLWMKAHFGLMTFASDDDSTTIDATLLFLHVLSIAKAHYGKPDANNVQAMANAYRKELIAGTHGTKRYVPGTIIVPPAIRPTLISFEPSGS